MIVNFLTSEIKVKLLFIIINSILKIRKWSKQCMVGIMDRAHLPHVATCFI